MKKRYGKPLSDEQLANVSDKDIDFSETPELGEDFWSRAKVVYPPERPKKQLTVRFDADVVEWFRKQGKGYQTRMNAVLRSYVDTARK